MFNNIGNKIKGLARALTLLGIIVGTICGVSMIIFSVNYGMGGPEGMIAGIAIIVIVSLVSWMSSFVLYGFGELIENSKRIADACEQMQTKP